MNSTTAWDGKGTPVFPYGIAALSRHALEQAHARSLAFGLRPEAAVDWQPVGTRELADLVDRHQLLCTHALPVMQTLAEQLRDTQSMVVLTDAQGVILYAQGDDDFLGRAGRVALRPGAIWSESCKGTNAIGTALAVGQSVQVQGWQHYLKANQFLSCSCAPIRDPQGKVLGAIDVSDDWQGHSAHTLALVRMSAAMVENHLFSKMYEHAVRVRFHANAQLLGTLMEGWAAFSPDGQLLASNRSAQIQWGLSAQALLTQGFAFLLGAPWSTVLNRSRQGRMHMPSGRLTLPSGIAVHAAIDFPGQWTAVALGEGVSQSMTATASQVASASAARKSPATALAALQTGDAQMARVVSRVQRIVGRDVPLLIQGETGTGKEWLAKAFHRDGPRAKAPFVAVNCGAIPESLIESELFGYEDGAFTGARRKGRIGQVLRAQGGTLFLDEIGDMPLSLQARLLRVLQEREVVPLGGSEAHPIDVQIVCATHRNLHEMMQQGTFREDLYYRIQGLSVRLPALRERSDIAELVEHILGTCLEAVAGAFAPQRSRLHVSDEVMALLLSYPWPGNLRQLHNVLRTAALMAEGEPCIECEHLPEDFLEACQAQGGRCIAASVINAESGPLADPVSSLLKVSSLGDITQQALQQALASNQGNVSAAARALGVSRNTVYRHLRAVQAAQGFG